VGECCCEAELWELSWWLKLWTLFVVQDQELQLQPGFAERRVETRLPRISMTASKNFKTFQCQNSNFNIHPSMERLTEILATVWRIFSG
jgi:hypothetical protein